MEIKENQKFLILSCRLLAEKRYLLKKNSRDLLFIYLKKYENTQQKDIWEKIK